MVVLLGTLENTMAPYMLEILRIDEELTWIMNQSNYVKIGK